MYVLSVSIILYYWFERLRASWRELFPGYKMKDKEDQMTLIARRNVIVSCTCLCILAVSTQCHGCNVWGCLHNSERTVPSIDNCID